MSHCFLPCMKVPSNESFHLNCNTLEQALTRLDLEQYLDVLQAEHLDLESLVIHTRTQKRTNSSVMYSYEHRNIYPLLGSLPRQ